jgi:hypothetical protein
MKRLFALTALGSLLIGSCATVKGNGELNYRFEKVAYVVNHCKALKGKEVVLKVTYRGWSCPKECRHPGITRSDSCFVDSTGCIYAYGTGGLDPITDVGKEVIVKATVNEKNGVCYLKVVKVNEVR